MLRSLAVAAALLALAPAARAEDQCVQMPSLTALKADGLLRQTKRIVTWCEPCGEKKPGKVEDIGKFEMKIAPGNKYTLTINGKDNVDLAFVYVQVLPGEPFKNLATQIGCRTKDVQSIVPAKFKLK